MISHNILYFTNIIYNIEKKLIRNYKLSINITFLKIKKANLKILFNPYFLL